MFAKFIPYIVYLKLISVDNNIVSALSLFVGLIAVSFKGILNTFIPWFFKKPEILDRIYINVVYVYLILNYEALILPI